MQKNMNGTSPVDFLLRGRTITIYKYVAKQELKHICTCTFYKFLPFAMPQLSMYLYCLVWPVPRTTLATLVFLVYGSRLTSAYLVNFLAFT